MRTCEHKNICNPSFLQRKGTLGCSCLLLSRLLPPPVISYALISQILPGVALAAFASLCFSGSLTSASNPEVPVYVRSRV